MSSEFVISMAEKAVYVTLMISGPLLAIALLVGLIVSIIDQAVPEEFFKVLAEILAYVYKTKQKVY
ncbi:hypothetical protein D3Z89_02405 [Bacillus subtilis]|nr:hypothetical protein D3Z89_02405 [Bacillus subtilis]